MGRETIIENAIIEQPEKLGYPDAPIIRHWRVDSQSGLVDLGLFPKNGPLVLVEAKACDAHDAASKCVGQLLMYYAGALRLGSNGLHLLRAYANDHKVQALSTNRTSHKMVTGKSRPKSWPLMSAGEPIAPADIRLFLALDGEPRQALEPLLKCLRWHHNLKIGLVIVRKTKGGKGEIVRVVKPR